MAHDADILIVGGGLNGPCLAIALAKSGLSSIVIDALPEDTRMAAEFDGRSYALALASVRMLGALGLWGTGLPTTPSPFSRSRPPTGAQAKGQRRTSSISTIPRSRKVPMGQMLEDRYLRRALIEAMASTEPLITHMPATTVVAQDTRRVGAGHAGGWPQPHGAPAHRRGRTAQRHRRHAQGSCGQGLGLRANGAGLRHRPRAAA
jgi:2-octaprenyl-6-methoxyphenol hydroxylase